MVITDEFLEILRDVRNTPRKMQKKYLQYINILDKINELIPNDFKTKEKIDILLKGEYNKCYCGKLTKIWSKWCSPFCKDKDPVTRAKISVKNTANAKERLEKAKQTRIERYGVPYVQNIPEVKIKTKEAFMRRYGVDSWSKTPEAKEISSRPWSDAKKAAYNEKAKATFMRKYGVEHHTKTEEYLIKRTNTILKDTGGKFTNYFLDFDRVREANIKKYGVPHYSQTPEGRLARSINSPMRNPETKLKQRLSKMSKKYSPELINFILANDPIKFKEYIADIATTHGYTHRMQIASHLNISYSYLNNLFRSNQMDSEYLALGTSKSYKEQDVYDFVKSLGVSIKRSDRTVLNGKEIDMLIESHKLGIEFNGIYYHSVFTGGKDKYYHVNKTDIAESKGYQLLQILESEWELKKDIWKSIIKSKLGIYDRKIFARKCVVEEISSKVARIFLDKNHLSGFIGASYHLGLFYSDELVAVISYGKSRFNSEENEIYRFASLLGVQVLGGLGKLLSRIPCENLITFADRRISGVNSAYAKFFINVNKTSPNWYGLKQGDIELKHRLSFTKEKTKKMLQNRYNNDMSIFDNLFNNGYDIIYDCGNLKFSN